MSGLQMDGVIVLRKTGWPTYAWISTKTNDTFPRRSAYCLIKSTNTAKRKMVKDEIKMESEKNVLGTRLETFSLSPVTGFNRTGDCQSVKQDPGVNTVCSEVTQEFLNFTRDRGNDLSSANELYGFPGLKSGDRWCLCASRWQEALDNVAAPPVVLTVTNKAVLRNVNLDDLLKYEVDAVQS